MALLGSFWLQVLAFNIETVLLKRYVNIQDFCFMDFDG